MASSYRLELSFPPHPDCLRHVSQGVSLYCSFQKLAHPLVKNVVTATEHACTELIRLSQEYGLDQELHLVMSFHDEACVVELIFDQDLPLELPLSRHESASEVNVPLEMPTLRTLWLEVVKDQMDRVFFRIEGRQRILEMRKYRRSPEKVGQLWLMGLAPKLRQDLKLDTYRNAQDQPLNALLHDQESGKVLKFDPAGLFILQRLDGKHTFFDIYMEFIEKFSLISPEMLVMIFRSLERAGMLEKEADLASRADWWAWIGGKINRALQLNISIPQADRLITTLYRWVRFLFHPLPLAGFTLFALSGFYPLSHERGPMKELFSNPALVIYDNPAILVKLYVLLTLVTLLHELSHGLTCKHFGGSVHRMGVMFYLAIFIFYTDASGSWSFPEKYKRIAVALAGPLANLICMALCFWIWHFQKPHIPQEQSVWFLGGYFCLFVTLFNFLPLIKMDGYFVLMDLTGIPNLREKAFSYLWQKMSSLVGLKPCSESCLEVSDKEAWILLIYSVSGFLFTAVFLAYPFFEFVRLVLQKQPSKAALLSFGVIVALTLYHLVHRLHQQLYARWHREYVIS